MDDDRPGHIGDFCPVLDADEPLVQYIRSLGDRMDGIRCTKYNLEELMSEPEREDDDNEPFGKKEDMDEGEKDGSIHWLVDLFFPMSTPKSFYGELVKEACQKLSYRTLLEEKDESKDSVIWSESQGLFSFILQLGVVLFFLAILCHRLELPRVETAVAGLVVMVSLALLEGPFGVGLWIVLDEVRWKKLLKELRALAITLGRFETLCRRGIQLLGEAELVSMGYRISKRVPINKLEVAKGQLHNTRLRSALRDVLQAGIRAIGKANR